MNITISKYTVEFNPFWSSFGPGTGEFHKMRGMIPRESIGEKFRFTDYISLLVNDSYDPPRD